MNSLKNEDESIMELFQVEELEKRLEMKVDWSVYTPPGGVGIEGQW